MKNSYLCLLILTFLSSCNTEPELTVVSSLNKDGDVVPYNINNPYEKVGRTHDQLFEAYYEGVNLPSSISAICSRVETIADGNVDFDLIKEVAYQPIVPAKVEYIVQHQATCVADIIGGSSLSAPAKGSLSSFTNDLVQFFKTEYNPDTLYAYVAAYEDTVLGNPSFTASDKRIILITTSVARHSAYLARKKPKKNTDPDWTILVGNIVAAVQGAEESAAKAVAMAIATGIATN